jgi:hypothetical protein
MFLALIWIELDIRVAEAHCSESTFKKTLVSAVQAIITGSSDMSCICH